MYKGIKAAKSSMAIDPDGLATKMLMHIEVKGGNYLTHTFNLSLSTFKIPDKWNLGKIIPLSKPEHQGSSYWPITLLSHVVKILEATLLSIITEHLSQADHKSGFRYS